MTDKRGKICFVCTDLPGPADECVFVEVEDEHGAGLRLGEWEKSDDGFARLWFDDPRPDRDWNRLALKFEQLAADLGRLAATPQVKFPSPGDDDDPAD